MQLEFEAVLALLMQTHRLSAVTDNGEPDEQMKERVQKVVEYCDLQLLLRMRDADRVKLGCSPLPSVAV